MCLDVLYGDEEPRLYHTATKGEVMRAEAWYGQPLPHSFYEQPTLNVAQALLGTTVARWTEEGITAGMIVETEAYIAAVDPAAHGYRGQTPRNRSMFGPPGFAYVYLTYGVHFCLNVVTEREGQAAAVLIRAIEPTQGLDLMRMRRGASISTRDLCRGPGRLCQALAIARNEDRCDLRASSLVFVAATSNIRPPVATSPRIGISQAQEWPWRYYVPGNRFVSGQPWR